MNLLNLGKMPFSFHGGWDTVARIHPSVIRSFVLLVLPCSLIPPLALLYAGSHHAGLYWVSAPYLRWQEVAAVFFVMELLSVPLMGWLIGRMAADHQVTLDFKDSFLLASITAVPMWLSSLGLLSADLWLVIACMIMGLMLAASVLYHGLYAILKMEDTVDAQAMSYQIFSFGGVVWIMLCGFVALPLML